MVALFMSEIVVGQSPLAMIAQYFAISLVLHIRLWVPACLQQLLPAVFCLMLISTITPSERLGREL